MTMLIGFIVFEVDMRNALREKVEEVYKNLISSGRGRR